MKKLLIILGATILISACDNSDKPLGHMFKPIRFEYDGHRYIHFRMDLYRSGAVHDPECPCQIKEESNGN